MAPKRLEPDVTASAPNQKWVSDLTWGTGEGWLDLAVVLDWESRAGVGGFRGERMSRDRVIQALTMALWRRRPKAGLIAHSDRGRQYAANDYPRWLNSPGLLCSRSRQGDCDDNAAMERVFHSLKIKPTGGKRDAMRKEAKADGFEPIEASYHWKRRPSTRNSLSPGDVDARMAA